ncbi:MAG: cation-transporting P-type ATPase [Flavobacteriales bacterium]|nr:cation-transporting P-type ATPase [Flavobacteriales bacterium]
MPPEAVLKALKVVDSGLSKQEAQRRLEKYGPNRLPEPPKPNALMRFLRQFHNVLIYVLLGASFITAFLNHWVDTFVILLVIFINAIIGFIQEGKAERAMDAIRHMLALRASVVRSGERRSVKGETLVPGDIVLLEAGDKVPADIRLLSTHGLFVQESILTGESIPVEKQTKSVIEAAHLADRSCMTFSGTLVTSGQGKGVVVATGGVTEIGRISGLLSEIEILTTPLVEQMNVFAKWLTALILAVGGGLLIYGNFISGYFFKEIFMVVVAFSVAAIPEGLPAVLTITLALGVQAMAQRNAIVRYLPAIETLGSVSVICTDKTGTLTRNEMAVVSAITSQHIFTLEGNGYAPQGLIRLEDEEVDANEYAVLRELARSCSLCNDAVLRESEGIWVVEGDPLEGALLAFSSKVGIEARKEKEIWRCTDAIPFDSKHRFMATLNHDHNHHAFIFVKGAPETILSMCKDQRGAYGVEPLDASYWREKADNAAAQGQRVLAIAVKAVKAEQTVLELVDVKNSLTFIGMVGMLDLPRSESVAAIAECHRAGIRVKMITGDHVKTALAIAKQIGLQNSHTVLSGAELDKMNDAELRRAILDCDIFARTLPEHKLRLVTALQSHGLIVAMTGDGVNDAPALKRADVGVAMGKKGSEAAKEASKLVLADDNFASIVAAVREGRTVYDNIKKVISWTLPTNAGESMIVIFALFSGMTLPVTPIQILWINLITAVTLGLALAFEPTEENVMRRPPRAKKEMLISNYLTWHIILVSILFLLGVYGIYSYAMKGNYPIELARTLAMNTIVVMEIFHLLFIRNIFGTSLTWKRIRGTRVVWMTISIIVLAQLALTYLPVLQNVFSTQPVSVFDWILMIGIGVALFSIVEFEKQMRLRLGRIKLGKDV